MSLQDMLLDKVHFLLGKGMREAWVLGQLGLGSGGGREKKHSAAVG
jgi:hypothetical protein